MTADDPDDAPTRPLAAVRKTPRIVLGDDEDDRPTVPLSSGGARAASASAPPEPAPAPESPMPAVVLDAGHVVTRRISGPRRLPSPDEARPAASGEVELPVGWLTVVAGPGRGRFAPVFQGMNSVGREQGNRIAMNWGDDEISRKEHCFITYDDEQSVFWIQHGGKSNLVRVNDAPVMAPLQLRTGDTIRIGQSKFRFVALCDETFNWLTSP